MSNKTLFRLTACMLLNEIEKDFHLVENSVAHENWTSLPQKEKKFFIEWSWNESSWLKPYVDKMENNEDLEEWETSVKTIGEELLAWAEQDNRMIVASNNRIIPRNFFFNRSGRYLQRFYRLNEAEVIQHMKSIST